MMIISISTMQLLRALEGLSSPAGYEFTPEISMSTLRAQTQINPDATQRSRS
jgi:hypothetical protein